MINVILAVLVLTIAGGAIAYLGDFIGSTIGKKRITIFGLRPRHTARISTVVAGMVIALLTVAILLGVNKGYFVALQKYPTILHNNHILVRQNKDLQKQAADALLETSAAKADAAHAKLIVKAAESKQAAVNAQLTTSRKQLADLQSELARVRAAAATAQAQLTIRQAALQKVSAALAASTVALHESQKRNSSLVSENRAIQQRAGPIIGRKYVGTLIYRSGQEVGRSVIHPQSLPAIRRSIYGFLNQVSQQAVDHGAVKGSGNRAVQVATVQILTESQPGRPRPSRATLVDESANITALAEQIQAWQHGDVVVLAYALGNAFKGEHVVVTLRPFPNRLVISKGDVLGTETIPPGDREPVRIFTDLQRLLVKKVRPAAIRAGMIPISNPQVHETILGEVPIGDLLRVLDQVQLTTGAATIEVIATRDTYSADQLKLSFNVKPASTAALTGSAGGA